MILYILYFFSNIMLICCIFIDILIFLYFRIDYIYLYFLIWMKYWMRIIQVIKNIDTISYQIKLIFTQTFLI